MQSVAGDPGRTRTCNPRSRNPLLYPVELRDRLAIAADRGTAAAVVIAPLYEKCALSPRLSEPDFVPRRHSEARGLQHLLSRGMVLPGSRFATAEARCTPCW